MTMPNPTSLPFPAFQGRLLSILPDLVQELFILCQVAQPVQVQVYNILDYPHHVSLHHLLAVLVSHMIMMIVRIRSADWHWQ